MVSPRYARDRDQARDMERIRLRALVPTKVWIAIGVRGMKRLPRRKR